MELKHAIFLLGLALALTLGRALCRRDPRLRDACAFLLVFGTTRADMMDINFISREWYRGTTRGIEVSWLDLLWITLLISLPESNQRRWWFPALGPMLAFFAYNALVVAFSDPMLFGIFELSKMLRQLFVFITIARYVEDDHSISIIVWALVAAVSYEFVAALRGRFIWKQPRVSGTLGHANILSMYELICVPVLVAVSTSDAPRALRRASAAAALLGAVTVLFTVSRNGVLTLVIVGLFLALTCGSLRRMTAGGAIRGLLVAAFLGVFVAMTYGDFKARFEAESLDNEYGGKVYQGRGAYILLAEGIASREPFGCGLNNWSWCVSNQYGPIVEQYYVPYVDTDAAPPRRRLRRHAHIDDPQAAPAHSLYAITLGETGFLGVLLLAVVWVRWFILAGSFLSVRSPALAARFGMGVVGSLIGAFSQSLSEWEIRVTPLAFLLHALLGATAAVSSEKPRIEDRSE